MDFQHPNNGGGNKTVCPSDRQLALRAKLRAGWSSSKFNEPLRPEEQAAIISVIKRNEAIETEERQRVGRLVERVEKIKQYVVERGPNCCRLCGEAFGLLRPHRIICENCKKAVCTKCSVDINIRYYTVERTREVWLCRVCSETREMWKKTGAWFYKGLPNYEIPHSTRSTSAHGSRPSAAVRLSKAQTCQSTPSSPARTERARKLTIRVCDSSSSSGSSSGHNSDEDGGICNGTSRSAMDTSSPSLTTKSPIQSPAAGAMATASSSAALSDSGHNKLQREDSLRVRTLGSPRSLTDGANGSERKLGSASSQRSPSSRAEVDALAEYDTISTASTTATNQSPANRRESNTFTNHRQNSFSSSWSISDSSSVNSLSQAGGSATAITAITALPTTTHCRDPLLGWLEVAVAYRESHHSLDATMVRARDLPPMDASNLTDPYCKLNIITAEGSCKYTRWQRTKTVHKTRNPEFNETINFMGVEPDELGNALLYVALFDEDKYGHDFLGAAKICLSTVHNSSQQRISVPLVGEDQYSSEAELAQEWRHGKVLISLCYNTKKRALVVVIKKCINLIPMDNNGSSDPFVKIQMKPDSHRNKKCKTAIKWRTLNPVFNEEFHFETSPHDLNKQTLVLTVWDKDLGKSNDFLGSLVIGYNSKGERLQQWLDCIRLPDHFHEKWHCLASDNPLH